MPCVIVTLINLAVKRGYGTIHAARIASLFQQNLRRRGQNNAHPQRKAHLLREPDSKTEPLENQRFKQEPLQRKLSGNEGILIVILWKTILICTPS